MRSSGSAGGVLFLALSVIEVVIFIWIAGMIGWPWVIVLVLIGIGSGLAIMRSAGVSAFRALTDPTMRQQAFQQVDPESGEQVTIIPSHSMSPEEQQRTAAQVRSSMVLFMAGIMVAAPGFLTSIVGVAFAFAPVRRTLAVRMGRRARPGSPTVIPGRAGPAPDTRSPDSSDLSGDSDGPTVIQGEILPPDRDQDPK